MDTAASNPPTGTFSQALQSLSSDALKPASPRKIHPRTTDMISNLGLRFPPAAGKDEDGRAGLLALMEEDLADIHPDLLDLAVREWVRTKAFMPKASELRNLAETMRKSHEIARARQVAYPPQETETRRADPFTRSELQAMVDAAPDTLQRQFFAMGLKGGFIVQEGERFREAGGSIWVVRSEFAAWQDQAA